MGTHLSEFTRGYTPASFSGDTPQRVYLGIHPSEFTRGYIPANLPGDTSQRVYPGIHPSEFTRGNIPVNLSGDTSQCVYLHGDTSQRVYPRIHPGKFTREYIWRVYMGIDLGKFKQGYVPVSLKRWWTATEVTSIPKISRHNLKIPKSLVSTVYSARLSGSLSYPDINVLLYHKCLIHLAWRKSQAHT